VPVPLDRQYLPNTKSTYPEMVGAFVVFAFVGAMRCVASSCVLVCGARKGDRLLYQENQTAEKGDRLLYQINKK
jgi:hypothetical protein